MSKELDEARDREAAITEATITQIRQAAKLQAGHPGECEYCGYESPRLIGGACGKCRDENNLR